MCVIWASHCPRGLAAIGARAKCNVASKQVGVEVAKVADAAHIMLGLRSRPRVRERNVSMDIMLSPHIDACKREERMEEGEGGVGRAWIGP